MTRAEEEKVLLQLVELTGIVAGIKAENERLKDENKFLRGLVARQGAPIQHAPEGTCPKCGHLHRYEKCAECGCLYFGIDRARQGENDG